MNGIELAQKDGDVPPKAGPIPKEALLYFKKKKLKPGFKYTDVWQEEHRLAFTVAKLMELDVLEVVRRSIEKALEDGTPLEEWKKQVEPRLEESGWRAHVSDKAKPSRLRTIYETNMRVARANGQHDRIQRTKKLLPYLVYELGPSKKHRDEHKAWAGLILPVDDDFWKEHYPPNDYGCKCRVRQITKREADKNGGPDEAPDEDRVEWELPNGKTGSAPAGVHPSFAYPMGTAGREKSLNDALKAAKKGQDGPKPVEPEKTSAEKIAHSLSDGARRTLADIVAACPGEFDTTGVSKLTIAEKSARRYIKTELTAAGLVGNRGAQNNRLGLYPTPLARLVVRILSQPEHYQ